MGVRSSWAACLLTSQPARTAARLSRANAHTCVLLYCVCCRNAVVLPAFETQDDGEEGRRIALEAVRMGKPYVAHKFE